MVEKPREKLNWDVGWVALRLWPVANLRATPAHEFSLCLTLFLMPSAPLLFFIPNHISAYSPRVQPGNFDILRGREDISVGMFSDDSADELGMSARYK